MEIPRFKSVFLWVNNWLSIVLVFSYNSEGSFEFSINSSLQEASSFPKHFIDFVYLILFCSFYFESVLDLLVCIHELLSLTDILLSFKIMSSNLK